MNIKAFSKSILVVTGGYPSVSQTFVLREIASMIDCGLKVHVLSPEEGSEIDWEQAKNFGLDRSNVTYLNWRRTFPKFKTRNLSIDESLKIAGLNQYGKTLAFRRVRFFDKLSKLCESLEIDLIHCHFVQWASEVGLGLSILTDLPLTIEAHDSHLPNYSTETLSMLQSTAKAIGCVSKKWVEVWSNKTNCHQKLTWLPNGVEPSEFPITHPVNLIPTIISISNCVAHKRPQDLLNAASILLNRGLQFRLQIIGGGAMLNTLKGLRKELNLEKECELLGSLPHKNVRKALSQSDIFALCSERESFGIVTVEAMASGLPTVVSKTAGSEDIVEESVTGFTYEVADVEMLANHLETLIKNPQLRVDMGLAGRKRVLSTFSWGRHMNILFEMLDIKVV